MFHTLHRALKFLTFCAFLGVAWVAYEQRHVLEPALIWYDVWDNGGFRVEPLKRVHGTVLFVNNSQTFTMETAQKARLNVRLMGLRDPLNEATLEARQKELDRKTALDELLRGKFVAVEMAYANANNIGGLVFLGTTNVNAWLVQRRMAFTSKDLAKPFPKEDQYRLLWAHRHRDPAKPSDP